MRTRRRSCPRAGNRIDIIHLLMVSGVLISLFSTPRLLSAQESVSANLPPANAGVFVTPIAGAPFSAEVVEDMTQLLKDGSLFHRKTGALIARDSQGRIHNELHEVLAATETKKPVVYSIHLYYPETRLNTFLNPHTHIARQRTLDRPPPTEPPSNWWLHLEGTPASSSRIQVHNLGPSVMDGLDVRGYRRNITIPDKLSGTGEPVVVTDEVWYNEELRINLLSKHNDPRTGEMISKVTKINPNEPEVELFAIPPEYKVVDMTPPEQESLKPVRVEP
jgi:hypothetical protein